MECYFSIIQFLNAINSNASEISYCQSVLDFLFFQFAFLKMVLLLMLIMNLLLKISRHFSCHLIFFK